MSVKLLTEHHLEFLLLKGGCTGSSESTLVKIPHCWKSHVTAHLISRVGHKYVIVTLNDHTHSIYGQVNKRLSIVTVLTR